MKTYKWHEIKSNPGYYWAIEKIDKDLGVWEIILIEDFDRVWQFAEDDIKHTEDFIIGECVAKTN